MAARLRDAKNELGVADIKTQRTLLEAELSRLGEQLAQETALLAAADEGTSSSVDAIDPLIDAGGLRVVRDTAALDAAVDAAIADSPRAVEDFRAGRQQAIGALVGRVMKQVRGADARLVRELLTRRLSGG